MLLGVIKNNSKLEVRIPISDYIENNKDYNRKELLDIYKKIKKDIKIFKNNFKKRG